MMEHCSKYLGSNVNKHHRLHSLASPLKKSPTEPLAWKQVFLFWPKKDKEVFSKRFQRQP